MREVGSGVGEEGPGSDTCWRGGKGVSVMETVTAKGKGDNERDGERMSLIWKSIGWGGA